MFGPDEGAPAATRAPDFEEEMPNFSGKESHGVWYGDSFIEVRRRRVEEEVEPTDKRRRMKKDQQHLTQVMQV